MVVKRIAACVLLLTLAGCYRQSEDSFVPSDGSGNSQITPLPPTTDLPPILEPTLDTTPLAPLDETPTTTILIPTEDNAEPTEGAASGDATATIVIFEPPTKAAPTESNLFSTLPTATVPAIITPIIGNPPQVTMDAPIASATPMTAFVQSTPATSDLAPTPTDLPIETAGECDYTIVGGDTLFRIALRNDVSLEDLLTANNLSESSIIQPGQIITIPDCVPEGDDTPLIGTATNAPDVFLPTPTGITAVRGTPGTPASTGSGQVYKVQPGDTLSKIAAEFDVTVDAIVQANDLVNPNRLSIGQELTIPVP